MFYSDDPLKDFERHDAEQCAKQQRFIDSCPRCSKCGKPIQEDFAYFTFAEVWICDDCAGDECAEVDRKLVERDEW